MVDRVAHSELAYTVFIATLAAILLATVTYDLFLPAYFRTAAPEMLRATVVVFSLVSVYLGFKLRQLGRANRQLQLLLARDDLTDVATRDYFFTVLAAQPEREGVCLMVDIDHFKQINDTHGHLVGDKVIVNVANRLRNSVRADDIVCRFGGDEFAIFLSATDVEHSHLVCERIRGSIAQHQFDAGDCRVAVTVSIGGSNVILAKDARAAIHQADIALYQAKNNGRDQIVFASPENNEPELVHAA